VKISKIPAFGAGRRVHLAGFVHQNDRPNLFSASRRFLQPQHGASLTQRSMPRASRWTWSLATVGPLDRECCMYVAADYLTMTSAR